MNLRDLVEKLSFGPEPTSGWSGATAAVPTSLPAATGTGGAVSTASLEAAERELVARARAGDQDAFAVLVRLHQHQVYVLALRMLHDEEDAGEATQEVFLAAWQGLGSFRGEAQLATWLYRITYNYCLKLAERRRREAQTRAELASESARTEHPAARLSQQHAQVGVRELCEMVRTEIAKLPPKYGAVLALRHLQELSYEEMAEVLRVPIGTVKTHLFRARAILKERLSELDRAASDGMNRAGELGAGLYERIGKHLEGLRKDRDA